MLCFFYKMPQSILPKVDLVNSIHYANSKRNMKTIVKHVSIDTARFAEHTQNLITNVFSKRITTKTDLLDRTVQYSLDASLGENITKQSITKGFEEIADGLFV